MFGLQWSNRVTKNSSHPMADMAEAAQLIHELPRGSPAKAVAEASAWLESIESEGFDPNHRLHIVTMLDEAAHSSVEELTRGYVGAAPGNPGHAGDWRVLMDYFDRLSAAYGCIIDAASLPRHADLAPCIPLAIVRNMRATTRSMKASWMRYLPPDRASWETLVRCYRTARARLCTESMVMAYASDAGETCALHELTVGVMLAAAAPQSLTPRQVEVAYRIAAAHRAAFTVNVGRQEQWRHYLFDLDNPGPPARIPEQLAASEGLLFFSAEGVLPDLGAVADRSRGRGLAMMSDAQYGAEFGAGEKLVAIEQVLRFWGENPPARRDERVRINMKIHVEVGAHAIRAALDRAAPPRHAPGSLTMLEARQDGPPEGDGTNNVATVNTWILTDYSTRGIGVRFARRPDRALKVGSVIAYRLERSDKWCVATVRRLRTDSRNQTDAGCEILAKSATLVTLEGLAAAGTLLDLAGSGPLVRTSALMLPEDPQLDARASLLFEPGTNAPGQCFVMRHGDSVRRIRLRHVAEVMENWDRVEFDVVDG